MNWTNRHNLIAGLGLILLVNAIALAGAAWNRSEPADSRLQLSERELWNGYSYRSEENSGIALRFDYRWPNERDHGYSNRLSAAKMQELGFILPTELNAASVRRYRRQLDRDGLLVLEFNGPLYQQQLQQAQQRLTKSSADLAALTSNKDLQETHQEARAELQREQTSASRLFIIDAGTDLASLRAKYPDRQSYAIVRGQISAKTGSTTTVGKWVARRKSQWPPASTCCSAGISCSTACRDARKLQALPIQVATSYSTPNWLLASGWSLGWCNCKLGNPE